MLYHCPIETSKCNEALLVSATTLLICFSDTHTKHSTMLEQQQPIKGRRSVNGGLVDNANNANICPPPGQRPAVTVEHCVAVCCATFPSDAGPCLLVCEHLHLSMAAQIQDLMPCLRASNFPSCGQPSPDGGACTPRRPPTLKTAAVKHRHCTFQALQQAPLSHT